MFVSPETQLGCYGFQFTAGGETGINTINTVQNADAPLYNLAGQEVSDDYKGLIIQNGKKSIKK
jgi:hypothetical protein